MPADFLIDVPLGVVFSLAKGVLGWDEVIDHMDRLQSHPDFRPEFNQLMDFREASPIVLSTDDVSVLARRAIFSARSKRAFVVADDLGFGLSRVFATYREIDGEPGITVFREMEEALDWLTLSSAPKASQFPLLKSV